MATPPSEPFSNLISAWENHIELIEERVRVFENLKSQTADREGIDLQIKVLRSEQGIWRNAISGLRAAVAERTGRQTKT